MAARTPLRWPGAPPPLEPSLAEKPLALLGRAGGAAAPRTLLWDSARRCFCFHWPELLQGGANRRYYAGALLEVAPWQALAGPSGRVSRSTCWYVRGGCRCDYTYGAERVGMPKAAEARFAPVMEELTERVFALVCPAWPRESWPNCANLNLYVGEEQACGWHADDEALFAGRGDDCLIVSLSLGSPREFWLSLRQDADAGARPDKGSVLEVDLGDGDLLTMEGLCQKHCVHCVPPGAAAATAGGGAGRPSPGGPAEGARINVTWRWVRDHKRRCPLWGLPRSPAPASPQALGGRVPPTASGADEALLWAGHAPVEWRRSCQGCSGGLARNCALLRGRWLCRRCWQAAAAAAAWAGAAAGAAAAAARGTAAARTAEPAEPPRAGAAEACAAEAAVAEAAAEGQAELAQARELRAEAERALGDAVALRAAVAAEERRELELAGQEAERPTTGEALGATAQRLAAEQLRAFDEASWQVGLLRLRLDERRRGHAAAAREREALRRELQELRGLVERRQLQRLAAPGPSRPGA